MNQFRQPKSRNIGVAFTGWIARVSRWCLRLAATSTQLTPTEPLQLLCPTIGRLIENPDASAPFFDLLRSIEDRIGASYLAIYIIDEQSGKLCSLASTDENTTAFLSAKITLNVLTLIEHSEDTVVDISAQFDSGTYSAIGLCDDDLLYGFFAIDRVVSNPLEREFLTTLVRHLAETICCTRRARVNRRQVVCEERATIARELHDSLAQSLTYLKIQSTRLQSHIDKNKQANNADCSNIDNAIGELRSNLNLAYSQLRELMTTFRLTMNGRHLGRAIEESIGEFKQRTTIAFDSDIRLSGEELSAQEELQLLQIVREGLSNVVRHSQATRANISLNMQGDQVRLTLTDNGVGIGAIPDPNQHYGLVIMQERTRRLGGELQVDASQSGGTRLQIAFTPTLSGVHRMATRNHNER